MKALVPAAVAVVVISRTSAAWACGQCFGDGSGGSILGWIALGLGGLFVYRLFSRR